MTLEKSRPCWTWFAFECSAGIMWDITNKNDGQKKPSALAFLHQYRAVQQSGKVDPIPNRAVSQPGPLDTEPTQMPPKNMLLLISRCLHLSHCFRFLFWINFTAVKAFYNFKQNLQFSHSTASFPNKMWTTQYPEWKAFNSWWYLHWYH